MCKVKLYSKSVNNITADMYDWCHNKSPEVALACYDSVSFLVGDCCLVVWLTRQVVQKGLVALYCVVYWGTVDGLKSYV